MSRERKRQLNWYQANDGEAIAAHLEKMAAKGWFLEKVNNASWLFRRGEPRAVHYAIAYYPEASVFDAGPAERQSAYIDFCRAAGWEFVTAWGPIQYFRSELPNPVPIETDEEEKLRVVRKAMRKTLVLGYSLLIFAALIWIWQQSQNFLYSPLSAVSDAMWPVLTAFYLVLLLFLTAILADYFVWCLRSKRSVARGGPCVKVHTRARLWGSCILAGGTAAFVVFYLTEMLPDLRTRYALLYCAAGIAAVVGLSRGVMWLLKRKNCSRGTVRGGFIAAVIVLSILFSAGMVPLASCLASIKDDGAVCLYTTEWGSQRPVYRDELPVTLEDLGYSVEEEDRCSYQAEEQRSFLASYGRYIQQPVNAKSALPYLYYTVCRIPSDSLRDFCWQTLSQSPLFPRFPEMKYPAIMEDLPEGALEGRCDAEGRRHALLYPDRIVLYESGRELTEAQREAVLGALEE